MQPKGPGATTIMLVEDDHGVAQTLTDALESSGYRVWLAETGADAKTLLEQTRPDLIILDLMLPDVDGLVLCSGLKAIADVPIVICSATQQKRDAILGLKLGADDFIAKPFDIYELEARVEAVLRRTIATGVSEADMGANPSPAGVQSKVWAPAASRVEVDFSDSERVVPLTTHGDGVWSAVVAQVQPGTRYRYRLNGEKSRPDPYSRSQP